MAVKSAPLLAHRGYAARYPENTLLSLSRAIEGGLPAVEFDLQLSADRVAVLMHDASLLRTCGTDDFVWNLDAVALCGLSASEPARLGSEFQGEPVPRLADVVALLSQHPEVRVFAEVKKESVAHFGMAAVLDAVLPTLAPLTDAGNPWVVISFVESVLREVRERAGVPVGWCVADYNDASRDVAAALAPDYLLTNHLQVPDGDRLWPGAWKWVIYEVVEPTLARRLLEQGADIIETMDPPALNWGELT